MKDKMLYMYSRDWVSEQGLRPRRATAAIDTDARIVGVALSSKRDVFRKSTGRAVALKRVNDMFSDDDILIIVPRVYRKDGDGVEKILDVVGRSIARLMR